MAKNTTSILSNKESFYSAVIISNSIKEVLMNLGLRCAGGNYAMAKHYSKIHQIDLPDGNEIKHGKIVELKIKNKKETIELLVENSNYNKFHLKRRLINEGLIKNVCAICGIKPFWNNKPLNLQLHHKNGRHHDDRRENICLLCPNCHTQTDNFSTKNINKLKLKKIPKTKIERQFLRSKKRKFEISRDDLQRLVWEKPTVEIAKDLNVSDKAISKRCKLLNILKPPIGYWQKQRSKK